MARGSAKTVDASSKAIRCFRRFSAAFLVSHSKRIEEFYVGSQESAQRSSCAARGRSASKEERRCSARPLERNVGQLCAKHDIECAPKPKRWELPRCPQRLAWHRYHDANAGAPRVTDMAALASEVRIAATSWDRRRIRAYARARCAGPGATMLALPRTCGRVQSACSLSRRCFVHRRKPRAAQRSQSPARGFIARPVHCAVRTQTLPPATLLDPDLAPRCLLAA